MFDTLIDTITSIVGVTILLFAAVTIISLLFKSLVAKHVAKLVGIIIYILFLIGCAFFRNAVELSFNIAFISVLCVIALFALIYFIRETSRTAAIANLQAETEEKCRSCELYEECEDCYKINCPYYKPSEE